MHRWFVVILLCLHDQLPRIWCSIGRLTNALSILMNAFSAFVFSFMRVRCFNGWLCRGSLIYHLWRLSSRGYFEYYPILASLSGDKDTCHIFRLNSCLAWDNWKAKYDLYTSNDGSLHHMRNTRYSLALRKFRCSWIWIDRFAYFFRNW